MRGVVYRDAEGVDDAVIEEFGYFECEGGSGTAVRTDISAVDPQGGNDRGAVEADKYAAAVPFRGYVYVLEIVARAAQVVGTGGAGIGIPCVRQADVIGQVAADAVAEKEFPSVVDRISVPGCGR